MKTLVLAATLLSLPTLSFAATKVEWQSVYTDMKKDCVVISSATKKAPIDFFESDCKSFGGYRLKEAGGDIRYAPTLSFNGVDLEMGRPGAFHDMASDKVEWIYRHEIDEEGNGSIEWKGFVYRLSVADPEGVNPDSKILYAVRLDGEKTCFLGNPKTNEAARVLVKDAKAPCVERQ